MSETPRTEEYHRALAALKAGTHVPAVDDFGSQYLARAEAASEPRPEAPGLREALDTVPEWVAFAVEYIALQLGEDHPTVRSGRRTLAALSAPSSTETPDD